MSISQILISFFLYVPIILGYLVFTIGTAVNFLVGIFLLLTAAIFGWAFFRPAALVAIAHSGL